MTKTAVDDVLKSLTSSHFVMEKSFFLEMADALEHTAIQDSNPKDLGLEGFFTICLLCGVHWRGEEGHRETCLLLRVRRARELAEE